MNDELLIALVKENALIYDPEDPKYMDAAYKVKVWNNIAQKLNSTGAQCKARNLEDGTDEAEEVEDYFPPEVVPTIETPEATTSSDLTSMSVLPRTSKRKQPPESTSPTPVKYLMSKNYNQEFNDTPKLLGTLEHPVDVFLYAISPTLKSLSPLLLNMAKSEIFATVQKFEKKMLEEQNAASSCPLPRQGYDGDLPPVSN
ncbi:hypothetical protein GE061_002694 [Apolygus lucorum]|uniref:MADF domain-containing protein n=1 Tax=Apolygus lucorum TaxID=248454 RepID=A0A8S9X5V6_APOLU|nr:hypothetical protein GE061_002694 [Apolygus lucorum]